MMEHIVQDEHTPVMHVVNSSPRARLHEFEFANYHAERTSKFRVTGLDATGHLDLTVLFPASGHVGSNATEKLENARTFARDNVYDVMIVHPNGRTENLPSVHSTGFVTPHDLSLHIERGVTIVRMWAQGSFEVGGFKAGREIELHWDGN